MKAKLLILIALSLGLCTIYACANTHSIMRNHPVAPQGLMDCSECHTGGLSALNHQAVDFYKKHGSLAGSSAKQCGTCHQQSFCSDCHTNKEELKPSDKFFNSTERNLPHRGDYLSQHKIDGRINPASCAKCHGRQNNERCATCHR